MNVDQLKHQLSSFQSANPNTGPLVSGVIRNSVWIDETPSSEHTPCWDMNNQIQEFQLPNNNFIKDDDKMHSDQVGILKKLREAVMDIQHNNNFQYHYSQQQLFLETFIELNGSNIDISNPVSNCYEQYSEKHMQLSFPLPFCLLFESIESLLKNNQEELKEKVRRNINLINVASMESKKTESSYRSTGLGGNHSFLNLQLDQRTQVSHQMSNQTISSQKLIVEEKIIQRGKTKHNSIVKQALATQFQFHHFHESTPLVIQSSPSPSPTDNKNPFRLHYQDKHNLQTQQTGSGTLSKWKYK